ncbi:MAG: N4-gp56 family major capsid protein [Sphaerochaetaceae bacterium]
MKKLLSFIIGLTYLLPVRVNQFDNTQTTGSSDLSPGMVDFYSNHLVDTAKSTLVHGQFAQKHPIPEHNGKVAKFRRYSKLAKALTPLTEGVTPSGNSLKQTEISVIVEQYGDYIELSDRVQTEHLDDNLVEATELLGDQAGETLDTLTREVLNAGTNVRYGNFKLARYLLVGGETDANDYIDEALVILARRDMKNNKVRYVDGLKKYIAIIHTDMTHDLQKDKEGWRDVAKYAKPEEIYNGEVGEYFGLRLIESEEAKKIVAEDLTEDNRELTVVSGGGTTTITVSETLTSDDQTDIVGRSVLIQGVQYTVSAAAANTITCSTEVTADAEDVVYPGEAGAKGRDVYTMVVIGKDSYGEIEISGESLENIVKPLGSGGSSDPLNQRGTTGWKATHAAIRLAEENLLRLEVCTSFNTHIAN